MGSIELKVEGMSCDSCVKHIKEALTPLAGVEAVEVDLAAGQVRVTGAALSAAVLAALDAAGYPRCCSPPQHPSPATRLAVPVVVAAATESLLNCLAP